MKTNTKSTGILKSVKIIVWLMKRYNLNINANKEQGLFIPMNVDMTHLTINKGVAPICLIGNIIKDLTPEEQYNIYVLITKTKGAKQSGTDISFCSAFYFPAKAA